MKSVKLTSIQTADRAAVGQLVCTASNEYRVPLKLQAAIGQIKARGGKHALVYFPQTLSTVERGPAWAWISYDLLMRVEHTQPAEHTSIEWTQAPTPPEERRPIIVDLPFAHARWMNRGYSLKGELGSWERRLTLYCRRSFKVELIQRFGTRPSMSGPRIEGWLDPEIHVAGTMDRHDTDALAEAADTMADVAYWAATARKPGNEYLFQKLKALTQDNYAVSAPPR